MINNSSLGASAAALSALSPLFATTLSPSFANPAALVANAQAELDAERQYPSQQAVALSGLFSEAQALLAAAAPLAADPLANSFLVASGSPVLSLPYTQTSASSSNSAAVSATSIPGATLASYDIAVSQLATAQVDTGTALSSSGSTIRNGTQTIAVSQDGRTSTVTFTVNPTDTNEQALEEAASAINSAGLGISASVTNDGGAGTSQLVVQSTLPGSDYAFTLTDGGNPNDIISQAFSGSGGTLGPGGPGVTDAQDAMYSINGVTYVSSSGNSFTLDHGRVSVAVSATTASAATVTVGASNATLAGQVSSLVNAYNAFVTFLSQNASTLAPSLLQQAEAVSGRSAAGLQALGITANSDGTLAVNSTTLQSVASSNASLVSLVLAGSSGFASGLRGVAAQVGAGVSNMFAAMAPPAQDVSTLPTRLSQFFGDILLGEQLSAGRVVNLDG